MPPAQPAKPSAQAAPKRRAGDTNVTTKVKPEQSAAKTVAKKPVAAKRPLPKAVSDARKSMGKSRGRPRAVDAQTIHAIFSRLRQSNPEPKGELDYVNAYTLLIAVVLSAQATDVGVNKATRALFAVADTPQKMLTLGEDRVRNYIKTIGLYRTKAKNVIALSQRLIDEFDGEVPNSREALETLPGVGRKTANVVLNIAFGEETIAVDTHLFRLSNRLRLAPGKTPLDVELGLQKVIPKEFMRHAHHWLILHGRYICKAVRPGCEKCVIADFCTSLDKRI